MNFFRLLGQEIFEYILYRETFSGYALSLSTFALFYQPKKQIYTIVHKYSLNNARKKDLKVDCLDVWYYCNFQEHLILLTGVALARMSPPVFPTFSILVCCKA